MSEYLYRQIYLPPEVVIDVKLFCAQHAKKINDVYKVYQFVEDVIEFMHKTKVKAYYESYSRFDESCVAFNIRIPKAYMNKFYQCLSKAASEMGEDISERSLLTTGVLMFLRKQGFNSTVYN